MARPGARGRPPRAAAGSAVVDFALVSGLVSLLFLAVFQVGLALHIRNTLIACASEGARFGARADNRPEDGRLRARTLIASSLSDGFATTVRATTTSVGGVRVVQVDVEAPLPVLAWFGPPGLLTVHGRAFAEDQDG
jgi:hypothetical protein